MTPLAGAKFLTIAECAFRTGLTIRALRVYEDHGLITPGRSPGGWRQYGPADLVRLNMIALLKTAGMSLAQIREVAGTRANEPALQPILQAQLETWKTRRLAADRGIAITEAALERLNTVRSLSVDELCNLIGAIEMTQERPTDFSETLEPDGAMADAAVLDSYVGFYQHSEYVVEAISRNGQKLHIWALTSTLPHDLAAPPELRATSETEFSLVISGRTTERQYVFERDPQGAVTAMMLRHRGVELRFPRIDESTAEQIKARALARIQSGQPLSGSETALRRLLDRIRTNQLDYSELTPSMAALLRQRLPRFYGIATYQGDIRSVHFRGVGRQGWDVYDVECEHGSSRWRILLQGDGKVADVIGVVTNAPAGLGP
jgi:DNA-binding transcriptional MerR regulator